jgi:hypothetical protein
MMRLTRGRIVLMALAVLVLAALIVVWVTLSRAREGRRNTAELQAHIVELTAERDRLRAQVMAAVSNDPQLAGMPDRQLRIGVPTTLAHQLVSTFVTGVADHVTLELGNLRVRRQGSVRRVVTLGDYDLDVRVTRVTARLAAGAPDLRFGGNQVRLALPVRVASGSGAATINFQWDGRTIGSAVCGDMELREVVTGTVVPATYRLSGTLQLSTTKEAIVVTPRLPSLRVKVRVQPSKASWALVQKFLDDKGGVCGFVLDRVNIREALEGLFARGFDVRLPVERVKPLALPVGIAQTMAVRGTPITIDVADAGLTITDRMIWLGANVTLMLPHTGVGTRQ